MPDARSWPHLTDEQVLDIMADEAPDDSAPPLEHAAFLLACARLAPDREDRILLVTLAATFTARVDGDAAAVMDDAERRVGALRDALALADLIASAGGRLPS
jgi:hypothetical protein